MSRLFGTGTGAAAGSGRVRLGAPVTPRDGDAAGSTTAAAAIGAGPARWSWRLVAWAVAVVAVAARLVPLLRGGGLTSLGNEDDGVYFAAGSALAHGLLPYADFLLLHPPGIVLLLAPFGLLARLTGDPTAFATARLVWTVLGATAAVLVGRLLRPQGLVLAALGGVAYALAPAAVYTGWTPMLETPAAVCVLLALVLLERPSAGAGESAARPALRAVAAGALLGLSADLKIWGAATVVAAVAWFVVTRRARTAVRVLLGAGVAVLAVCLPFFVTAPGPMWRMVVLDQLGRPRAGVSPATRLADLLGPFGARGATAGFGGLLLLGLGVAVLLLAVAVVAVPAARLAVVLALVHSAVLLAGPSWFRHYPVLAVGPLLVGLLAGAGALAEQLSRTGRWLGRGLLVLVAVAVVAQGAPLLTERFGTPFPGATLGRVARDRGGCVTSDDPSALIALDVLGSDLSRRCTVVADLGGYSYELDRQRGAWVHRLRDQRWQQIYLADLGSGTTTLSYRYPAVLDTRTRATIRTWPVVAQQGAFVLRAPHGS